MLAEIFLRQREEKGRLKGRAQVVDELVKDMEDAETLEDAKELLRKAREWSMPHRRGKTGHDERRVRLEGERREGVA